MLEKVVSACFGFYRRAKKTSNCGCNSLSFVGELELQSTARFVQGMRTHPSQILVLLQVRLQIQPSLSFVHV